MKKFTILLALLLFILYLRTFGWLINAWLTNPYYSHGFLIPVISGFIVWKKYHKSDFKFKTEHYKTGIGVFALGLILHVIGFIIVFPFLSALSFLFTLSGGILYLHGKPVMRSLLFPVSLLIFAIPLPFLFLQKIATVLQTASACYSALIIEMLGIPVTRAGAWIHLQNASFFIGLPCSGMNTLISLLALATVFIYILKCPQYKKAALFCITIPIAILANILRVTSIILVANHYGLEPAMKFFHNFAFPLLVIIAFILLILISELMGCKMGGENGEGHELH